VAKLDYMKKKVIRKSLQIIDAKSNNYSLTVIWVTCPEHAFPSAVGMATL
jgi:hypothetical protein